MIHLLGAACKFDNIQKTEENTENEYRLAKRFG